MKTLGIQIISYNRPNYLFSTLDSLLKNIEENINNNKYKVKIIVVDQSDLAIQKEIINKLKEYKDIRLLALKQNLGMRGATNVVYESGFWDDCDYVMLSDHDNSFIKNIFLYQEILEQEENIYIMTGYHSPEHDIEDLQSTKKYSNIKNILKDYSILLKSTCRSGHMVLRCEDFLKVMPCDLKAGNSDPLIGLDWWITHWAPSTPHQDLNSKYKYPCIGCLSGGVVHIGTDSTWGNKDNQEYSPEELFKFAFFTTNDLVNNYSPKHIYVKTKYWYEDINEKTKKNINNNNKNKILIAYNYIWPAYGNTFLEDSIKSIIAYVKEYWLFINKYSYIGTECDDDKIDKVLEICKKYKKIRIFINNNPNKPELERRDNFQYYTNLVYNKCKQEKLDIDYLLLIQSDEIYSNFDFIMSEYINTDLKEEEKDKSFILTPINYFHDSFWKVVPNENYTRPSIINFKNFNLENKIKIPFYFLHMSYVLSEEELRLKLANWGHRNDISERDKEDFIDMFNKLKYDKSIQDFYPIRKLSSVYHKLEFDDTKSTCRLRYNLYNKILENNK